MADNPPRNNAAANGGAGNNRKAPSKNNFFQMRNRFQSNRDTGPKQRTVSLLIPQSSSSSQSSGYSSGSNPPTASFGINKKTGPYCGWQLYFPETGTVQTNIEQKHSFCAMHSSSLPFSRPCGLQIHSFFQEKFLHLH